MRKSLRKAPHIIGRNFLRLNISNTHIRCINRETGWARLMDQFRAEKRNLLLNSALVNTL